MHDLEPFARENGVVIRGVGTKGWTAGFNVDFHINESLPEGTFELSYENDRVGRSFGRIVRDSVGRKPIVARAFFEQLERDKILRPLRNVVLYHSSLLGEPMSVDGHWIKLSRGAGDGDAPVVKVTHRGLKLGHVMLDKAPDELVEECYQQKDELLAMVAKRTKQIGDDLYCREVCNG